MVYKYTCGYVTHTLSISEYIRGYVWVCHAWHTHYTGGYMTHGIRVCVWVRHILGYTQYTESHTRIYSVYWVYYIEYIQVDASIRVGMSLMTTYYTCGCVTRDIPTTHVGMSRMTYPLHMWVCHSWYTSIRVGSLLMTRTLSISEYIQGYVWVCHSPDSSNKKKKKNMTCRAPHVYTQYILILSIYYILSIYSHWADWVYTHKKKTWRVELHIRVYILSLLNVLEYVRLYMWVCPSWHVYWIYQSIWEYMCGCVTHDTHSPNTWG